MAEGETMKQIKVDEDLFVDLVKYHVMGVTDDLIEDRIRRKLAEKMDRMIAREDYKHKFIDH